MVHGIFTTNLSIGNIHATPKSNTLRIKKKVWSSPNCLLQTLLLDIFDGFDALCYKNRIFEMV